MHLIYHYYQRNTSFPLLIVHKAVTFMCVLLVCVLHCTCTIVIPITGNVMLAMKLNPLLRGLHSRTAKL
jgi:hypothetical protein